ncbi:MAG: CDP-alcohol phosphatidyltransferase family protein [Planctomycetota bacterium]
MNAKPKIWNVPNQLSAARLVLSFVVFGLIASGYPLSAFWCFVVAAGTDWIDGWYARKFDQVTKLGRILDPFCDKILICGAYILIAVEMNVSPIPWYLQITGWMAVVVTGRELLVTVLRSLIEGSGGDFSAKMPGKIKMWFQCFAVGAALIALWMTSDDEPVEMPKWLAIVLLISVWGSILSTLHSGWLYVVAAKGEIIGEHS